MAAARLEALRPLNKFSLAFDVAVLGGTGFLGKTICRKGAELGLRVISLGVDGPPWTDPNKGTLDNYWLDNVKWRWGDVRDPDEWMAKPYLATGARAIINAAAVARDSEHYGSMQEVNVDAVVKTAQLAREVGASRYVHVGCQAGPMGSSPEYAATKAAGVAALRSAIPDIPDTSVVIAHPGPIFGTMERLQTWLQYSAHVAAFSWHTRVRKDTEAARAFTHMIHIEYLATALLRAALDPEITGELDVEAMAQVGGEAAVEWVGYYSVGERQKEADLGLHDKDRKRKDSIDAH